MKKKDFNKIINKGLGIINIYTTFNNTIITITDSTGNTIAWASCGSKGFKGSKRNTPFAAQVTAESVCKKAMELGVSNIEIRIKGPGAGRDAALRAIVNSGMKPLVIKDVTSIPHNGCRPPKRRRV
jgi:small subunit ribosomal protein S11